MVEYVWQKLNTVDTDTLGQIAKEAYQISNAEIPNKVNRSPLFEELMDLAIGLYFMDKVGDIYSQCKAEVFHRFINNKL